MDQFVDSYESCLLIVATDNWRDRIIKELSAHDCKMLWSANVYEAAALAVTNKSSNGSILTLLVMIDYLTPDEMRIFRCLNEKIAVRTIAVSAAANTNKIAQAKSQGAHDVVLMSDLSHVTDFKPETPINELHEPKSPPLEQARQSSESVITDQAADVQSKTPPRPERKPPVKEKTPPRPTLSQDELDALLG